MATKKRGETYSYINIIAVLACFAVIVIILTVLFADNIFGGSNDESSIFSGGESSPESSLHDESRTESSDGSLPEESSAPPSDSMQFTQINVSSTETARGDLILVNDDLPFDFNGVSSLVNIYDKKDARFQMGATDIEIEARVMDAFNAMIKDFYTYSNSGSVTVITGYRTYAQQQSVYNSASDKSTVSIAGGSDFHTGLSLNLTVYPSSDGAINSGKFVWLRDNCAKYGFVLRFPAGSESITGFPASDRIFRYVGIPHAYFMDLNNLSLEGYLQFIKGFTYSKRYSGICEGETYEVYYQPANSENTLIVPDGLEYTYSGDNQNGYIVTVKKR